MELNQAVQPGHVGLWRRPLVWWTGVALALVTVATVALLLVAGGAAHPSRSPSVRWDPGVPTREFTRPGHRALQ